MTRVLPDRLQELERKLALLKDFYAKRALDQKIPMPIDVEIWELIIEELADLRVGITPATADLTSAMIRLRLSERV
jgi:hypothetical protein